jgi:hypothetical protein
MPIDKKLMKKLKAEYGPQKGERVYYALEAQGKIKSHHSGKPPRKGKHR